MRNKLEPVWVTKTYVEWGRHVWYYRSDVSHREGNQKKLYSPLKSGIYGVGRCATKGRYPIVNSGYFVVYRRIKKYVANLQI